MENRFDLTTGSVMKNLLKTAAPLIIAMLVETGYNVVDTIFVGRLGPEAIAAVTLAFPVTFAMMAMGMGIAIGSTALIARAVGGKDFKHADNIAEHSILISIVLAVVMTIAGLFTIKPLFTLLGAGPTVIGLVDSYITVIYAGSIFLFIGMMGAAVLRGVGDMKTQMRAMIFGATLNIVLDPILIFGLGLGIRGAAIATIISRGLAAAYVYQYLLRGKTVINLSPKDFIYKSKLLKKILSTGLPTSLGQMSMAIGWSAIAKISSLFGPIAIAAYGIGFRIDTVFILPVLGVGMALITIVGQNLGAGKPERARLSVLDAIGMTSIFLLVAGAVSYAFAPWVVRIFTSDPLLIEYAVWYARSLTPTYFFMGLGIIIGHAILGTGNPFPNMIISLIRLIVIAVPLAYVLSIVVGFGVIGIWWGLSIAIVFSGLISLIWYGSIDWEKVVLTRST